MTNFNRVPSKTKRKRRDQSVMERDDQLETTSHRTLVALRHRHKYIQMNNIVADTHSARRRKIRQTHFPNNRHVLITITDFLFRRELIERRCYYWLNAELTRKTSNDRSTYRQGRNNSVVSQGRALFRRWRIHVLFPAMWRLPSPWDPHTHHHYHHHSTSIRRDKWFFPFSRARRTKKDEKEIKRRNDEMKSTN